MLPPLARRSGSRPGGGAFLIAIFGPLFLLLGFITPARADNGNDYGIFTNPPRSGPNSFYRDNKVYQLGTTIPLSWETGMPTYFLNLWQQFVNESGAVGSSAVILEKDASAIEPGGTAWTVQTYGFSLGLSNIFFLFVSTSEDGAISTGFTSHYFNITRDAVPSSTTGAPPGPTKTHSPQPQPSPSSSSSSSADGGLKIGLGLGFGLGVPLVAVLCFLFGRAMQRRDRGPSQPLMVTGEDSPGSPPHPYPLLPPSGQMLYAPSWGGPAQPPAQLDATPRFHVPSELPAESSLK